MSDRPILFSGPMVRALLDGRKTQTRRVLKLPTKGEYVRPDMGGWAATTFGGAGVRLKDGTPMPERPAVWNQTTGTTVAAAFDIGDRLWVRETWLAAGTGVWTIADARRRMASDQRILYAADGGDGPWWPSIHMPREFSRLTLTVTDVRVLRLQEISEADAVAEGCFKGKASGRVFDNPTSMHFGGDEWASARDWYADLWDRLNAKRGYGWDANPWVVAVSFTVHCLNIDDLAPPTIGDGSLLL